MAGNAKATCESPFCCTLRFVRAGCAMRGPYEGMDHGAQDFLITRSGSTVIW